MTRETPQGSLGGRQIVAFDFDGTLTTKDSFTTYLSWRVGRARHLRGLAALLPATIRYLADRDRGRLKAAAVREFLKGLPRVDLEAGAEAFADAEAAHLFRPDALETWNRWGSEGAHRVIVTASPETVVAPFARKLGAEALIGTRLAFDSSDRVAGGFIGENCRGPEKVRRLHETYGEPLSLAAAYGDTSGDREMIAIAAVKGYRVFEGRP